MRLPFLEFSWGRWHIPYHIYMGKHIMYPCHYCVGNMMYFILFLWDSQRNLIIHIYIQHVIEWFIRTIFLCQFCKLWIYFRQLHKIMMFQWSHWGLDVLSCCISSRFPVLYINKDGIQSTPSESILVPPVLLACLYSVVRHNKNSILPLIYNIASKNHP